ncbi:PAS domain S-box protein [Sphingomonas ginkgonis]|uniref:histidine kinase n=1 Tax=Sphingomonas ginkgonis TaxID=2315330 RepID=A0A429V7U5_9SPHN|nr:PAS domain S-box protein [Sphingomonas ginkgonis]RST30015.1 PAS domain S-box protein [Sphingomonas ginkgonis]
MGARDPSWPAGGGMAERIARFDWASGPLGAVPGWAPELRAVVDLMLASLPIASVVVGAERVLLYNDAAAALYGAFHPDALGQPIGATFGPEYARVAPAYDRVFAGESVHLPAQSLDTARRGVEEVFDAYLTPIRDGSGRVIAAHMLGFEVGTKLRAEQALRESEDRTAFLLALSDALRPLRSAAEIEETAARLLGQKLRVARVNYGRIERSEVVIERGYHANGSPVGRRIPLRLFGRRLSEQLSAGRVDVVDDTLAEPALDPEQRDAYRAFEARAHVGVPLVKGGRLVATLCAIDDRPRDWTPAEVLLIEQVAERTWGAIGQIRAEAALRESMGRYERLFEHASDAIWVAEQSGRFLEVNPAALRLLGYSPEEHRQRFACDLVRPEQRPRLFSLLGELADGQQVTETFDVLRSDGSWIPLEISSSFTSEGLWQAIGRDVTERTRAEQALRASEERFRQFGEASSNVLWIRDAASLEMEYVSPAFEQVYRRPCHEVMGDVRRWAALVVPEDRAPALERLEQVRRGQPVVYDFRVRRADGAFRWISHADFPLFDAKGRVERIGGIATDVTDARQLAQHQSILLAELQHRVRNILAMVASLTARTAESARSVDHYAELIAGRLMALSRTQTLLTRSPGSGVAVRALVEEEVAAQAHSPDQYRLDGPDLTVPPKSGEVLALAVHELATNALKHGALAVPEGRLRVAWTVEEDAAGPRFRLRWNETRPALADWTPPARRGFGTELIERRVLYELGGEGRLTIGEHGAEAVISFPLTARPSLLETGAPNPPAVSGGSLDTSGEPDLAGTPVLVVADDRLLASDLAHALADAGAAVLGPFGAAEEASAAIAARVPGAAVLAPRAGASPCPALAARLRSAGIVPLLVGAEEPRAVVRAVALTLAAQAPNENGEAEASPSNVAV